MQGTTFIYIFLLFYFIIYAQNQMGNENGVWFNFCKCPFKTSDVLKDLDFLYSDLTIEISSTRSAFLQFQWYIFLKISHKKLIWI